VVFVVEIVGIGTGVVFVVATFWSGGVPDIDNEIPVESLPFGILEIEIPIESLANFGDDEEGDEEGDEDRDDAETPAAVATDVELTGGGPFTVVTKSKSI
jgi:hypothetical protein